MTGRNEATLVAVDDGYAQIKVWSRDDDGTVHRHVFRSSIRAGRDGLGSVSGEGSLNAYETEEGEEFTVSEGVAGEGTRFDNFHVSPMNRVLVHHGLREGGYGGRRVDLVVGLPVADYFLNGRRDMEKGAAKSANLKRGVKATLGSSDGDMATLGEIVVGCQALAAFVDYAMDDDLVERVDMNGTVAIVDIGGRTTDIAVVISGGLVDFTQSGTANLGVLDVYSALQDGIRSTYKVPKANFPTNVLDEAVRTGTVKLFGRERDVTAEVKAAVREVQLKIEREIDRKIGMAATLDSVVFVGGGAELFRDIGNSFEHGVVLPDPEFANARGLWKYSELRRRAAREAA